MNLLRVLISTIRTKFAAIFSKIRLWTSWNFISTRIITRIRMFFTNILSVRPKNRKDYYTIFGWMISRKLVYAILIIVGVVSIWYIASVNKTFSDVDRGQVRTYNYDSISLRFTDGKVRILGKGGYLAYEGNVTKGYCTGEGTLYDPKGALVYEGHFEKNKFEENGTEYYPTGNVRYTGEFHDNLYDGTGKLYRENGSIIYDGAFGRGKKNGDGMLCGENGSIVYQGQFANDEIVYASFVGKSASEVGEMYKGKRRIWQGDNLYCVLMRDIGAMYSGSQNEDPLVNS